MHTIRYLHTDSHNHSLCYTCSHIYTQSHMYTVSHTEKRAHNHTHCLTHSHTYSLVNTREYNYTYEYPQEHTHTQSHTHAQAHMQVSHICTCKYMHTQSHIENLTWSFVLSTLRPGNLIRWVFWALNQTHLFSFLYCPSVSYSRRTGGPMSSDLVGNIDKGEIQSKSLIIEKSGEPRCVCLHCF